MHDKLVPSKEDLSEYIRILEENGYIVRKLSDYKSFSNQAVLAFFYEKLAAEFGMAHSVTCKSDYLEEKNKRTLKKLQNKLTSHGFTKKYTNHLVYKTIETIFSDYQSLGRYKPITELEDIFTEKGLWMLTKISQSAKIDHDPEWFEQIHKQMCNYEDDRLRSMKMQREKELLEFYAKKEKD